MELFPRFFRETDKNDFLKKFLLSIREEIKQWEMVLDQIANAWNLDRAADEVLNFHSFERGLNRLPDFVDLTRRRKLLKSLVRLYQRKGELAAIRDAIRIVSQISANIYAPWTDLKTWKIGYAKVWVDATVGISYRSLDPRSFTVGSSTIGNGRLCRPALNQSQVYTFIIELNYEPSVNELLGVVWVAELLKRAVDHYRVVWPPGSTRWIVGYSETGIGTRVSGRPFRIGYSKVGKGTRIGPLSSQPASQPFVLKSTLGENTTLPGFSNVDVPMWPFVVMR
jgi:hypothetical protein